MKKRTVLVAAATAAAGCRSSEPPTPPPDDMVLVAGGQFWGASSICLDRSPSVRGQNPFRDAGEDAVRGLQQSLPTFSIDRYPVRRDEYLQCVRARACSPEAEDGTKDRDPYEGKPVALASWKNADDYCAWRHARLPSLHEWQKAARGTDGRPFPTGLTWDPTQGCAQSIRARKGGEHWISCLQTSSSGMRYAVLAGDTGEWTSDLSGKMGCRMHRDGAHTYVRLFTERIDDFDESDGRFPREFRCVREAR
jgi:formylglycine-generating enzyme required for sulfatase activity